MRLTEIIAKDHDLTDFINRTTTVKNSLITGANVGAFDMLLCQIVMTLARPIILLEENENKAQKIYSELVQLLPEESVQIFPVDATIATQTAVTSPDELSSRIQALNFLLSAEKGVVVATPQALQYKLSAPTDYQAARREFKSGKEFDLSELTSWLVQAGFRRENLVAKPGEFALRGDILDIYPLDRESPVRIEFFGDEIDTIKEFDLASQRSQKQIDHLFVSAAQDRVFTKSDFERAAKMIRKAVADAPAPEKNVSEHFADALAELDNGFLPQNYAFLVDFLIDKPRSLLDYLSNTGLVMLDDWPLINQAVKTVNQQNQGFIDDELKTGAMIPGQSLRSDFHKVWGKDEHNHIYFSLFQRSIGRIKLGQLFDWQTREPEQFFSQMPLIKSEIESFQKKGQTVILQADNNKDRKSVV